MRKISYAAFIVSTVGASICIPAALYLIFLYVPNEVFMGPVQRLFYFHVGAALASYFAYALLFAGSLWYLATQSLEADTLAAAAGEVAFLFCSIVLSSGMIWGKAVWGVWFNTEPRLLTFLLLWFLSLSYVLLRKFVNRAQVAKSSAVLGVSAAVCVPLMVFSIKLLPAVKQLHPEVIERAGLAPSMRIALAVTVLAVFLLQAMLLSLRVRLGLLELKRQ